MIRTIAVLLVLLIFFIIWLPLLGVLMIVRHFNRKASGAFGKWWAGWTIRLIFLICGTRITIRGAENIPKDRPVLFVSNHRSYFDIFAAVAFTPVKNVGFIAKRELGTYPILGWWCMALNALFLDRDDLKQELKVILEAISWVKSGSTSMWICPEGMRNRNDDPLNILEFKEGSLKIAEKSGAPVVPVAFTGTREIFERQFPAVRVTHLTMEFGKPFDTRALPEDYKKKPGLYAHDCIKQMLVEEQERRKTEA